MTKRRSGQPNDGGKQNGRDTKRRRRVENTNAGAGQNQHQRRSNPGNSPKGPKPGRHGKHDKADFSSSVHNAKAFKGREPPTPEEDLPGSDDEYQGKTQVTKRTKNRHNDDDNDDDIDDDNDNYTPDEEDATNKTGLEDISGSRSQCPAGPSLVTPTPSVSPPASDDIDDEKISTTTTSNEETERLRSIIRTQFDLEIMLKHRELRSIEDEIAKITAMMIQLREHAVDPMASEPGKEVIPNFVEMYSQFLRDPRDTYQQYQLQYMDLLKQQIQAIQQQQAQQQQFGISFSDPWADSRSQRTSMLRSSSIVSASKAVTVCTYKKSDGTIVKIVCPKCQRSNFGNVQGFLNHSRLSHALEYPSQEEAAKECGVPYEEGENSEGPKSISTTSSTTTTNTNSTVSTNVRPIVAAAAATLPGQSLVHPIRVSGKLTIPSTAASTKFPAKIKPQRSSSDYVAISLPALSNKEKKVDHLAEFMRKKNLIAEGTDLSELAKEMQKRISKAHLLEDEEEDGTDDTGSGADNESNANANGDEDNADLNIELGEEATPFERAIAEAKKLNLDPSDIKAAVAMAATQRERLLNGDSENDSTSNATTEVEDKNKQGPHNRRKAVSKRDGKNVAARRAKNVALNAPKKVTRPVTPVAPVAPLLTRSRAKLVERSANDTDSVANTSTSDSRSDGDEAMKKSGNVIGQLSKYIQIGRFF